MIIPRESNRFSISRPSPREFGKERLQSYWLALVCLILWLPSVVAQQMQWIPQGAAPNLHGQVENIGEGEVSGGIQAVALHPKDANTVYVGAVNGGLWKSINAMGVSPTWQQLTDDQDFLSIGAIEFDPTDTTNQTIVAGMGRFSSLAQAGGTRSGLLRSINGGKSWLPIGSVLRGLNVSGVAPRGQTIIVSANDADNPRNVRYLEDDLAGLGSKYRAMQVPACRKERARVWRPIRPHCQGSLRTLEQRVFSRRRTPAQLGLRSATKRWMAYFQLLTT